MDSHWGPWMLDTERYVLFAATVSEEYEVDLDDCTSSAEVLDWICQVSSKEWADDAVVAGLVRALADVLEPQANLCSNGDEGRLTSEAVRALIRRHT